MVFTFLINETTASSREEKVGDTNYESLLFLLADFWEHWYFPQTTTMMSCEQLQATFYSDNCLQNGGHKENRENKHTGY